LGRAHFFFLFSYFPEPTHRPFPVPGPSTFTSLPCPRGARPGAATLGTCRWSDPPPSHASLCRVATTHHLAPLQLRASPPPSSAWCCPHRTPTIPSSLLPQCHATAKGRRHPRHSLFSRAPHRRPKSSLPSDGLVEPVLGRRNPSSTPDFIQATPPTASTGESHPEPLHPRLVAPLLTPILPRDAGHVGAARRSSEHRHRLGPPPHRTSSAIFMSRHCHGEPPAPSCCPTSGLHPGGAHPAHRTAPLPTVSRCLPRYYAGRGRGDRAPVRAPARPRVRLSGRLGHWPMGRQPDRGSLNRLLAQRSCRPRAESWHTSRKRFSFSKILKMNR
jgi:hypothetical protein